MPLDLWADSMPGWIAWIAIAAGPFVGSFLGVLVRRLPRNAPWAQGRSRCESCGGPLRAWELLPIASYLALRGRCARCEAPIAPTHLAIELAATAVAATACLAPTPALVAVGCVLGWTLLALAWIDAEHFWLPDGLTLPLIVAGLAAAAWLAPEVLADRALAAIAAYGGLRLFAAAYSRLRGREGLGEGDAKLLAAAGAWLGTAALPWVLALAGAFGLALVAGLAAWRRRWPDGTEPIPFGPALAAATWAVWLLAAAGWPG